MGFPDHVLGLIKCYLENCMQSTLLDNAYLDTNQIIEGVLQGSVLGPTLFLYYVNDIMSAGLESGVGMIRYDTALFVTGPDLTELEIRMNKTLSKLNTWTALNHLTINARKTQYMIFKGTKRVKTFCLDLRIDNTLLDSCDSYEYLSLTLDSKLVFEQHVNKLITACNHRLFTLSKIRKYLRERSAVQIYKSLIMSRLNHCCVFYRNTRI